MYLLDTDTLTYLQAGHQSLIERISRIKEDEIGTTIISSIEMLRERFDFILKAATGAELLRAQYWLDKTEKMLKEIIVIPFDQEAVDYFERLRQHSTYRKIGRADLLIAASTLAKQATLVTRNLKHFRQIPNLQIENWID
jgi:tRNA(fMet)-specific endonuclease VapC